MTRSNNGDDSADPQGITGSGVGSDPRRQVVLSPPPLPRGKKSIYSGVPRARARPIDAEALEDVKRELFYKLDTLAPAVTLEPDVEYGGIGRFRLLHEGEYSLDASVRQVGEQRVLDVERLSFGPSLAARVHVDVLDALIRVAASLNRHPNLDGTDVRVREVSPGTETLWKDRGVDIEHRQTDQATLRPYFGRSPEKLAAQYSTLDLGNAT